MSKILICRENRQVIASLYPFLMREGFELVWTCSGKEAVKILKEENMHLFLTDIEFKNEDGLDVIRRVREESNIPIVVLSKKVNEDTKISALNAGADDYISFSCNPLEFTARIHSQVRRYTKLNSMCENIDKIYRMNDLEIDDIKKEVRVKNKTVYLTPIEYKILRLLVQEKGRVFSNNQIYENVWNMEAIGADNTIAVHIRHIREKIESDPNQPKYLKVVWGSGYKVG